MTNIAKPKVFRGGNLYPVNVTKDYVACTLNTKYNDMGINDIVTLKHFPKTVVLLEYDNERS